MAAGMAITLVTNVVLEQAGSAALKAIKGESPAPRETLPEEPPTAEEPAVKESPVEEPAVKESPAPRETLPSEEPPVVEEPPSGASAAERAAEQAAEQASEQAAEQASEQAAEKAAEDAAEKAAARAAQRAAALAAEEAIDIGVEVGAELTAAAAEDAALASTVVGIPLAVIDIILTAATIGLQVGLKLDPDSFEPNGPGDWGFAQDEPEWVQAIVGGVPLIGNLLQLFGPALVFHSGCPDGWDNEDNLCYAPPPQTGNPDEWWECHAFLCTLTKKL